MRPERLRVAIVGCGRMGAQHARSVGQFGHHVAFACDVDLSRAAALAAHHDGCRTTADPAAISWDELDAVFVCTPPFARGPVESLAASAGVPIFLEKPIGLSAAQCLPALAAVRERGLVSAVGYMNRYRRTVQHARGLLRGERVLGLAAHWVGAAYRVPWWANPALSGGQLNEQCTHLVDLARYLVGEIAEVASMAQPSLSDGGPTPATTLQLRFHGGALGTLICACQASEKQIGLQIFTARGLIALEGWDFRWSSPGAFGELASGSQGEDPFLSECAVFLEAVRTGDPAAVRCDLADALRTQRVVDAARAALDRGRPVRLAESAGPLEGEHALEFA